jgi:hypothetical protein
MSHINDMMQRIQGLERKMRAGETDNVRLVIEQGRLLWELKKQAPYSWLEKLSQIGIHERVARRYLTIGECWATDDRTPESGLLEEMPYDLLKLEWLCRLPLDDLRAFVRTCDCRREPRGSLIKRVQRMLGQIPSDSQQDAPGLDPLRKESDAYVRRVLKAAESLDSDQRQELAKENEAKFSELQQALKAVGEPAAVA